MAVVSALLMLAALAVPLAGTAIANHAGRTLEVSPEDSVYDINQVATLTANLSSAADAASGVINIDFENENGANDPDKSTSRRSPDYTCNVEVGASSCSISYTGTESGNAAIRAWVDEDKVQSTDDSDVDEGRFAGPDDCDQTGDPAAACAPSPSNGPPDPGTGCGLQVAEPDCTDLVRVRFTRPGEVATTLDCDDSGGEDTEREAKASDSDDMISGEQFRCVVQNQFGEGMNDVQVNGENESGVNDPDSPDGANYTDADYGCTTTFDEQGIPGFEESGVCYIDVEQVEGELGTAEICFYAGTTADGPALCALEDTDENATDGEDEGNDLADQAEVKWEDVATFLLDCEPETDSESTGTTHEILCTATSPTYQTGVSDVTVSYEIAGTGDLDMTNTPQTPDGTCTTGDGGTCTIEHTTTATGLSTYRVWIDDGNPEPQTSPPNPPIDQDVDQAEGRDEATTPGRTEPDNTDVVENNWVPAPEKLTMTPAADSAKVGQCNPFTITATDADDEPAASAKIHVEQVHQKATNDNDGDEPTVSFCVPSSGPNPSDVDPSFGDRRPSPDTEDEGADEEDPNNTGTAGGQAVEKTDDNGKLTIGIKVSPGQGSDGSGTVRVTAFFDADDNRDPDTDEPKDSSVKTWVGPIRSCPGHARDSRRQIVGTPGADVLKGTGKNEVICGLGGNDRISAAGGRDLAIGGGGKDKVSGGAGRDKVKGNAGDDRLRGNGGNDALNGGSGKDACFGGPGKDTRKNCEN
jgi:hypothetical protein